MAHRAGGLHLLTIGAIFVVVFAAMWAGVQFSRGELVPQQPIDAGERQLRDALWREVGEWRADRGLGPARRSESVGFAAQELATAVAAGNGSASATHPTGAPGAGLQPNSDNRCSHVGVRHTVEHPRWNETGAGLAPEVAEAVAGEVVAALAAADDAGLLRRGSTFRNGIGVVAEGPRLVVVYRSCAQRRISP